MENLGKFFQQLQLFFPADFSVLAVAKLGRLLQTRRRQRARDRFLQIVRDGRQQGAGEGHGRVAVGLAKSAVEQLVDERQLPQHAAQPHDLAQGVAEDLDGVLGRDSEQRRRDCFC